MFDPTMLVNAVYEIQLLVRDANGNTSCALVDGQMMLGPVILPRVDLQLPEIGPDLTVERIYYSRRTDAGDFAKSSTCPFRAATPMGRN